MASTEKKAQVSCRTGAPHAGPQPPKVFDMTINKLLATSAVLAALTVPAMAADVIIDVPAPPVVEIEPVFTWSGFYAGVHGGYAFSGDDGDTLFDFTGLFTPLPGTAGNRFTDSFADDAGFIGGQVGVLYEVAPFAAGSLILGADADLSYVFSSTDERRRDFTNASLGFAGVPGAPAVRLDTEVGIDLIGHARLQAGVSAGRLMGYVAGGLAFSDADFSGTVRDLTVAGAPAIGSISADGGDFGYTVGAGANYAFTDNVFANLDYRYTDLGDQDITLALNGVGTTTSERDLDFHQVRVGLNFKFN